jgi:hypothetical protein
VGEVAGDNLFKGATVWRQRGGGGGQAAGGCKHLGPGRSVSVLNDNH